MASMNKTSVSKNLQEKPLVLSYLQLKCSEITQVTYKCKMSTRLSKTLC